jgi:hypothetical protein
MRVYFKVVGARLPYGARGKTLRRGKKRTLVDFGKLGQWRVKNDMLDTKKPDPEFGKVAKEALGLVNQIFSRGDEAETGS